MKKLIALLVVMSAGCASTPMHGIGMSTFPVRAAAPSFRSASLRMTAAASPGTAGTAANPVAWADATTIPNLRFSDGTNLNYVSTCVPTTTGDTCTWNSVTGNWQRSATGSGTGNFSFSANTMDLTGSAQMTIGSTNTTSIAAGKFITYTGTQATVPPTITWTAPTLGNSWVNFGGSFINAGYYKDAQGWVHLRGLVKSGNIGTGSSNAPYQLPAGFRPLANTYMATVCGSSIGILEIESAGYVDVAVCPGGNSNASFDNIAFYAEQ